ncbi:MAG: VWA domain-containing protein [Terriglobia bacterium]|jgi:VWFA-related protein
MQIRRFRPSVLMAFITRGPFAVWPQGLLMTLLLLLPSPAAPQATPDQGVIQAETHVVLVNVVVKDKHGKPVNDLSRDDFVLLDNNQEQKIALFALEDASVQATALSRAPGRLTFTNRPGSSAPAVTVFLFDELNTSLTDQELAKKDFLRYLRELPADSRVFFFVLGDSLALLHDFSQDMASLLAALEKHSNRVNPEVTAATAPPASANSLTGGVANTAQWDSFIRSSNQPYIDYSKTVRATRTAEALQTIAGHMQGIPGRKTLIWISGGFPIQLGLRSGRSDIPQGNPNNRPSSLPSGRGGGGSGAGAGRGGGGSGGSAPSNSNTSTPQLPGTDRSFESDVERAIRALNEADVAVYPVDARGVTTPAPFQANRSSIGKRNQPPKTAAPPDFNYETLETLAEETGGLAFHHINDLNIAIQEAASDARVIYSLAFYPPAGSLDGSYHRLELTVKRPGVKLRYRPGYVAARDTAVAPPLAEAIANPIALAGIGFSVHLDPMEGGYKASITIDPRNITLQPKDGRWIGSLQFLVVVGKVEQLTTIPLNLPEATFHQIQDKGLILGARVKTPPGTTGFSLGFRDIPSGIVGTLHVEL